MNIVLLHGIWDTGAIYRRMAAHLKAHGHHCFHPDMEPANAAHGLIDLAEKVNTRIDEHFGAQSPIVLIGFSMGALIARYYLQALGGAARTSHYFSIAGPHHGTLTAHLWPGKAARDMRPGSAFLDKLNGDLSAFDTIEVHSYRTPFDLMILPSRSSHLDWAQSNHRIPAAFHHRMVVQARIIEHITATLAEM